MDRGVHPGIAALRALTAARAAGPAVCELCAERLGEEHEHLVEAATGEVACCCTACALLFEGERQERRRLPRDARHLAGFALDPAEWASLDIPVRLAFLTRRGERVEAAYPSPGALVVHAIDAGAWAALAGRHAELAGLRPAVESLLVNRLEEAHDYFIVPLDRAYRLAGLVRAGWRGFTGGAEVRRQIRDFCAGLKGSSAHA